MKIQTVINKLQRAADKHGNMELRFDYDKIRKLHIERKMVINISGEKDKEETFINIETSVR